ncbi:methyltransferase domain-containing protein [bacterium]|nr:methyltransferase domain-containing protein [bacterium]
MMTRAPYWRTTDKQDWGFKPLSWYDCSKEAATVLGKLKYLFSYSVLKRRINKTLNKHDKRCISLGSGVNVPDGWIGFDRYKSGRNVFPVNLLFRFPLQSNSVHELLAEHILEHFFYDDVFRFLEECHRVLIPRGKLRVVCPDALNLANLILEEEKAEKQEDVLMDAKIHCWPHDGLLWARTINRLSHQWGEHKSLLSAKMIKQILEKTGFAKIALLKVNETVHFEKSPDIHQKRFPNEKSGMSFAVEAIVPK